MIEFGIGVSPRWAEHAQVRRLVQLADTSGLDLFAVEDHPYQWRFDDTWTLLAYLAGTTSRIRVFPDVVNLPLRPPAVLAKAAASLDRLTGGRVELGLGAGAFWDAIAAMGGPRRTPAEAVDATEEAIDVIRLVWSGRRGVRYGGRHYRLSGLHTGPIPVHAMGIWLGAVGPRMLDLVGRKADGWVPSSPWAPPDDLPALLHRIEDAAVAADRDPNAIRRVYNLAGRIGPGTGEWLVGPVPYWVDELTRVAELGMDAFVLSPAPDDPVRQARLFAEEVVPAVRDAAARSRSERQGPGGKSTGSGPVARADRTTTGRATTPRADAEVSG